jgi:hypothetical protein
MTNFKDQFRKRVFQELSTIQFDEYEGEGVVFDTYEDALRECYNEAMDVGVFYDMIKELIEEYMAMPCIENEHCFK